MRWRVGGGRVARAPAMVLGVHCRGFVERGRGSESRTIAAGRVLLVPRGGWTGSVAPVAVVRAAPGSAPVLRGSGGDRAVADAGHGRSGDCTPSGTSGVNGVAGTAARLGDAGRQPGLSGDDCTMARGAGSAATEACEADHQSGTANVCPGPAGRCRGRTGRGGGAWPDGAVEGSTARATAGPAMGYGLEPAADCRTLAARFPGRQHHAHQPRSHLPGALRPGSGRPEA